MSNAKKPLPSDREKNRATMPLIAEFVDALRAEMDDAVPGSGAKVRVLYASEGGREVGKA